MPDYRVTVRDRGYIREGLYQHFSRILYAASPKEAAEMAVRDIEGEYTVEVHEVNLFDLLGQG